MITACAAVAAVTLAALLAVLATPRPSSKTRRRDIERRDRYVVKHPGVANLGDIERRLDEELTPDQVDYVLTRAGQLRVDSPTLWSWLEQYGAASLALALAAGYGYPALLKQLRRRTPPDRAELEVLAYLSLPSLFADDMSFAGR